jgi:hypothetical protein
VGASSSNPPPLLQKGEPEPEHARSHSRDCRNKHFGEINRHGSNPGLLHRAKSARCGIPSSEGHPVLQVYELALLVIKEPPQVLQAHPCCSSFLSDVAEGCRSWTHHGSNSPALCQGAKPIELRLEDTVVKLIAGLSKALQRLQTGQDGGVIGMSTRASELAGLLHDLAALGVEPG